MKTKVNPITAKQAETATSSPVDFLGYVDGHGSNHHIVVYRVDDGGACFCVCEGYPSTRLCETIEQATNEMVLLIEMGNT